MFHSSDIFISNLWPDDRRGSGTGGTRFDCGYYEVFHLPFGFQQTCRLVQYLSGISKIRGLEWSSIFIRVSGRDDAQQGASLFNLGFDFNSEFEHRLFQMESIDDTSPKVFAHFLVFLKRPLDRDLQRFLGVFAFFILSRVHFALQLSLKGELGLGFEFQNSDSFQGSRAIVACVGASVAMLGKPSLQVNRRSDVVPPC
jgi:hypothetical protein